VSTSDDHEIRQAGVEDAADVARLLHDFNAEYDEPTPSVDVLTERLRELLAADTVTVLLGGTEPIGFALLRFRPSLWSATQDCYLEELYVVPKQRGQGIGRALMEAVMTTAREAGAEHLELTTGETDTEARGLYESIGMTNREGSPDGPRMLYYELDL
jgi:ribosomal protein S18 acetylase RimI-like enzyme